ncbi:MAG: transposase, partial [Kiritimatiellia bacterium]
VIFTEDSSRMKVVQGLLYFYSVYIPVKKVARMIKERIDQVLTFFVHRHTNAHAESMNSRIQAMIKKANGYRNRERLCTDMFFHFGGLNLHP